MELSVDVEALAKVCGKYGVVEVALFGSMASGSGCDDSDIDLLYVLKPDATLGFGIENLNHELEVLFGRRVDLVARGALHPRMRERVLAQAKVLYAA